jgi:hypothetical protein
MVDLDIPIYEICDAQFEDDVLTSARIASPT